MEHTPFHIQLLPVDVPAVDGERLGEIRVGAFVERFLVHPFVDPVETVAEMWLPSGKVVSIPDHRTVNDDGEPISEWSTTIEAVSAFLASAAR